MTIRDASYCKPTGTPGYGQAPSPVEPCADGSRTATPMPRRTIGRFQFFALGFGSIIGSAWVVVLGDWLGAAGPLGACLAFAAGGVLMCLLAAVYAELSSRMPEAGGEFIFAYRIFGVRAGFFVGWFVTLHLTAVAAFEAIVLPWMLQVLFPGLSGPVLYSLMGEQITLDAVVLGTAGVLLMTFLNYRDVRLAVRFQSVVTYGFLAVAIATLALASASGSLANVAPPFSSSGASPWWIGAAWIFANTAFFLNGFQAIPQAIEESAPGISAHTIARVMIVSVVIAVLFYCAALISASMATPWQQLAGVPLATAVAVEHVLPDGLLSRVVLLAAAFSLLKTWNSVVLIAARVVMAQARLALLPERLGQLHPRHATPATAVVFLAVFSLAGMLLGRGAVLPLVNMASICLAFTFVLACIGAWKLRRSAAAPAPFVVPGGTPVLVFGALLSLAMSLIALFEPLVRGDGIPLEWILILGWGAMGFVFLKWRERATRLLEVPT